MAREKAGAETLNYEQVVYAGFLDKYPMGTVVNRSLTIKSGQARAFLR